MDISRSHSDGRYRLDEDTIRLLEAASIGWEVVIQGDEAKEVEFAIRRAPDPTKPWFNYAEGGQWLASYEVTTIPAGSGPLFARDI